MTHQKLRETRISVSRTSLVVQWLKCHAPNARDLGVIPGWAIKTPHIPTKSLHATAKSSNVATRKSACCNEDQRSQVPQLRPITAKYFFKISVSINKPLLDHNQHPYIYEFSILLCAIVPESRICGRDHVAHCIHLCRLP